MKEETIPTMDDVLDKCYTEVLADSEAKCIYPQQFPKAYRWQALKAMTEWEQIKVAPLLKRIEELERENERLKGLIEKAFDTHNIKTT